MYKMSHFNQLTWIPTEFDFFRKYVLDKSCWIWSDDDFQHDLELDLLGFLKVNCFLKREPGTYIFYIGFRKSGKFYVQTDISEFFSDKVD